MALTAIRARRAKWGPEYAQKHDLSSLRLLGSPASRSTRGVDVVPRARRRRPHADADTWWQTETE
jgi:acetyl-CoA synthetase